MKHENSDVINLQPHAVTKRGVVNISGGSQQSIAVCLND